MSRIGTVWRSVSKNTRGAPPVYAALWNTGLVAERVMKVSAALTSADFRSAAVPGAISRTGSVTGVPPVSAWPEGGHNLHRQQR